jgi:hypothetical protein
VRAECRPRPRSSYRTSVDRSRSNRGRLPPRLHRSATRINNTVRRLDGPGSWFALSPECWTGFVDSSRVALALHQKWRLAANGGRLPASAMPLPMSRCGRNPTGTWVGLAGATFRTSRRAGRGRHRRDGQSMTTDSSAVASVTTRPASRDPVKGRSRLVFVAARRSSHRRGRICRMADRSLLGVSTRRLLATRSSAVPRHGGVNLVLAGHGPGPAPRGADCRDRDAQLRKRGHAPSTLVSGMPGGRLGSS